MISDTVLHPRGVYSLGFVLVYAVLVVGSSSNSSSSVTADAIAFVIADIVIIVTINFIVIICIFLPASWDASRHSPCAVSPSANVSRCPRTQRHKSLDAGPVYSCSSSHGGANTPRLSEPSTTHTTQPHTRSERPATTGETVDLGILYGWLVIEFCITLWK